MQMNQGHTEKPTDLRGQDRGFTIVEVIVAIAILSFGILAVASMQIMAIRGNAFAGGVTEASTWAGDQAEKLMRLSWDDSLLEDTDGDGTNGLDDVGFDDDPDTTGDSDQRLTQDPYTIYWNVVDNLPIDDTKTIHVIVVWMDHGVQKRTTVRRVIPRII
jgi:prepilin-type N-terminal cleavage/methylation domain-containing protein